MQHKKLKISTLLLLGLGMVILTGFNRGYTGHNIGENYGGGIVFYISDKGQHGLIAASVDQSKGIQWQSAAKVCTDYSVTMDNVTYSDWYLPSKDELNLIYKNLKLKGLGGFAAGDYWSATEGSNINAWSQSFENGSQNLSTRGGTRGVRAIRAF
jgi:hypothetical protein